MSILHSVARGLEGFIWDLLVSELMISWLFRFFCCYSYLNLSINGLPVTFLRRLLDTEASCSYGMRILTKSPGCGVEWTKSRGCCGAPLSRGNLPDYYLSYFPNHSQIDRQGHYNEVVPLVEVLRLKISVA